MVLNVIIKIKHLDITSVSFTDSFYNIIMNPVTRFLYYS